MYRNEDLMKIKSNLNKIQDDASNEYKKLYEPTVDEIGMVYTAITNYVKRKKRIAYGGFAQNTILIDKNPDESFYKEVKGAYYKWPDIADIEFYSYTPVQDMIELTNELHSMGFKYVEGGEAVHPETFKISVNFIIYCDITYMPKNIYEKIPTLNINNIICAHPHFMMVDAYRILTDPMTSYFRLNKPIQRFPKLLKYYKIDMTDNIKINDMMADIKVMKVIKQILKQSKMVVVGFCAYNYYMKKVENTDIIKIPFYEAISMNLKKHATIIYKYLVKKFTTITVKEYNPFFTFMDHRVEYYHNNILVLKLYGNNKRCTVYNYSEKKHMYFGTYNLVYMYLLFNYFNSIVMKDNLLDTIHKNLLYNINHARDRYLDSHNMTVVDKSPFQDFTTKCFGKPHEPSREAKEERIKNNYTPFVYKPNLKNNMIKEFTFSNNSGMMITLKEDLIHII
jgi:hypothetical protein